MKNRLQCWYWYARETLILKLFVCIIFVVGGTGVFLICISLAGTAPKPKLSMFWALSQNYQHFFWKMIWLSWSKLSEKLKNDIEILVGTAVLELLIKTCKFLRQFASWCVYHFSKKCWWFWDSAQNMLNFGLGCSSHLSIFLVENSDNNESNAL